MRRTAMFRTAAAALLAAPVALAAAPAPAQLLGGDDDEDIRNAAEAGAILPFDEIVGEIGRTYSGTIVEAELEDSDEVEGGWVYEIEVLTDEGVEEIVVDAGTGRVVEEDD